MLNNRVEQFLVIKHDGIGAYGQCQQPETMVVEQVIGFAADKHCQRGQYNKLNGYKGDPGAPCLKASQVFDGEVNG